jgi:serine/threonine protein kinase
LHHLLFPQADGDLEALLHGELRLPENLLAEHAILRQAYGLSSAIETVHSLFTQQHSLEMIGYHYDLKPKNILVKGGKFLLTDFGLSRLELVDTGSIQPQRKFQGWYYAPECLSSRGEIDGRKADVWSLGCILAMIATFLHSSHGGVKSFEESRKTHTNIPGPMTTKSFHANGRLNTAVPRWLEKISKESPSAWLQETSCLILQQLCVASNERPDMPTISRELFFISQKSVFEYCCRRYLKLQEEVEDPISLRVESERYRIWGESVGFTQDYGKCHAEVISAFCTRDRFQQFSSGIYNSMIDIEDELQFIESWSANSNVLIMKPTYVRLKALNDKLQYILPQHIVDGMTSSLHTAMLDGKSGEELLNMSNTFQSNPTPEYNSIGALAEIKQVLSETDDATEEHDNVLSPVHSISVEKQFGIHSLGTSKRSEEAEDEPALFEWIEFGRHPDGKLQSRVPKIARLFSNRRKVECSGLCVLPCKGYYKDDRRYALIYEIPRWNINPPQTLHDLINGSKARRSRPDLGERFELARKIVNCVLEVHKVSWVHKSICSNNIIFLRATPEERISVSSPYLIGFNHSRGNNPQTFTEGLVAEQRLYYHPEYLRNQHGFLPEYDFYSIGLVLLEVGIWRTLNHVVKDMDSSLTAGELQKKLVSLCEDHLGHLMGSQYRDAVKVCLHTTDFTTARNREIEVRNEFEIEVVNRLARCRA